MTYEAMMKALVEACGDNHEFWKIPKTETMVCMDCGLIKNASAWPAPDPADRQYVSLHRCTRPSRA